MKFTLDNIGSLKHAELELGSLTIICGENNMGKTYATHAVYGFLKYWPQGIRNSHRMIENRTFIREKLKSAKDKTFVEIDVQEYIEKNIQKIIANLHRQYDKRLPRVLAASRKYFGENHLRVELDIDESYLDEKIERTFRIGASQFVKILKKKKSKALRIEILSEARKQTNDKQLYPLSSGLISDRINAILINTILKKSFPNVFIAGHERTGASIFRKELDFARNRIVEELGVVDKDIDPFELVEKSVSRYSLPVRDNVDFIRNLSDIENDKSFIAEDYKDIIKNFEAIAGGTYKLSKRDNEVYFMHDSKPNKRLTMSESSSSVRSLLIFDYYLRHVAQEGDLLIIDEPELNLHPKKQRALARLFAKLVNAGIKVFITTHSDYIIKELNTLIALDARNSRLQKLAEREKYEKNELISHHQIRAYIAEEAVIKSPGSQRRRKYPTLTKARVDEEGIDPRSFSQTIDDMNRIEDEIEWGGNE